MTNTGKNRLAKSHQREEPGMTSGTFDRRRFLAAAAAASVAPYVRTSHAAGSLTVGFWDHWVPGANAGLTKLCNEWAAKEKVDLKIDFITSQRQNVMTRLRLRLGGDGEEQLLQL